MNTTVSTKSMLSFIEYMKDRNPGPGAKFFIDNKDCLVMEMANDSCNVNTYIVFGEDSISFQITVGDYFIEKTVNRHATFNGAIIEFMTKGADHFMDIVEQKQQYPKVYADYYVRHNKEIDPNNLTRYA